MEWKRPLGGMEHQFHQHNALGSTNFCSILFVEGSLDCTRLDAALDQLARVYPQLLASISKGSKPAFVLGSKPSRIPYRILPRADDQHWRSLVEKEILRRYEDTRIFVTVLEGAKDEKNEIIISLDHSLADGRSGYAISQALIAAWNGEAQESRALSAAFEQRLPAYYRGWRGLWRAFHYLWKKHRSSPRSSFRFGDNSATFLTFTAGFSLETETVAALQKKAQEQATNINGALCSATLISSFELMGKGEEATIALNTPVCLRQSMQPPAAPRELGMFISGLLQWQTLKKGISAWDLARSTRAAIHEAVAAGESILLARLVGGRKAPPLEQKARQFSPSLSVSNVGRLESLGSIGTARVSSYRNLVSIWPQDSITVVAIGYEGRLNIDVHTSANKFVAEPRIAERLARRIEQKLRAMAEGANADAQAAEVEAGAKAQESFESRLKLGAFA